MKFESFQKLPRLSRNIVITEKIDGTNAQIKIVSALDAAQAMFDPTGELARHEDGRVMFVGSRSRWLDTSSKGDNFSFAKWALANIDELWKLGEGTHFGEWWGLGIQRGYGLNEKRFSLFNTHRWNQAYLAMRGGHEVDAFPRCCHVVPVLGLHTLDTPYIDHTLATLATCGSQAAPGFMNPEGIIVFHTASGQLFKKTFDDAPKGAQV